MKICNGYLLICDISSFESIKFLETQIEKILSCSDNCSNIHLIANLKDGVNIDEYYHNFSFIEQFAEKFGLRPNYVNLAEYNVSNDRLYEKFVDSCVIKKKSSHSGANAKGLKGSKIQKGKRMSRNNNKPGSSQCLQKDIGAQSDGKALYEQQVRDMSASPKKSKTENCSLF